MKTRFSLLPPGLMAALVPVLEHGAEKWGENDWQKPDRSSRDDYDAAMRHIDRWWRGEMMDESGNHHLLHAICRLSFIWWHEKGKR